MTFLLNLLAFFGVLAILGGCIRSALRLLRGGVESYVAGAVANARAGRGDLSGLNAAREWSAASRAAKRWFAAHALGWLGLLIVPLFTPWTAEIYAASALLWLRPRRRRPEPPDASEALYGRREEGAAEVVRPRPEIASRRPPSDEPRPPREQ
jgi:hypothetical protein